MNTSRIVVVWYLFCVSAISLAMRAEGASSQTVVQSHSELLRKHKIKPRTGHRGFRANRIWQFVPEFSNAPLERRVLCGGDFDGDGFADIAVGEPEFDSGTGRVVFFFGNPAGLKAKPDLEIKGARPNFQFGDRLQFIGDIDGDGIDDFVVREKFTGSPELTGEPPFVFFGRKDRIFERKEWLISNRPNPIGDVNGDGFDDVAVYVPVIDRVDIYHGSSAGLSGEPGWTVISEQEGSHFGHDVAGAGDVNGDGFDDLLVGAMKFDGKYRDGGKTYLYLGSAGGLSKTNAWAAQYELVAERGIDDMHEQFFGWGLSTAGDVDSDGFDDILVGACYAERGDRNEGIAFLFRGGKFGPAKDPSWIAESNIPLALFGQIVCSGFDLNGDGFDDVLVGLPQLSDGQQAEGGVAVYYGSKHGLRKRQSGITESDHTHENLGAAIFSAGDLDGDGYSDVVLVGPGFEVSSERVEKRGRIVVCYGSASGLPFLHRLDLGEGMLVVANKKLKRYETRYGSVVYWGPPLVLLVIVSVGFEVVRRRLKKKSRTVREQDKMLVRLEERTRIAKDLHDHFASRLTEIALSAQCAADSATSTETRTNFNSIKDLSNQALEALDELIWVTNLGNDKVSSLLDEIGDFAVKFLSKAKIRCRLDFPEQFPDILATATWRHNLLGAAKESLRNAVNHSQASIVSIRVAIDQIGLHLEIKDDGTGFDLNAPKRAGDREGHGLSNIRSRLASLGGRAEIKSDRGSGTTVKLRAPFEDRK